MTKMLYGAGEYAELLAKAELLLPAAKGWLDMELTARGVKLDSGHPVHFTKAIHDEVEKLLARIKEAQSESTEPTADQRHATSDLADAGGNTTDGDILDANYMSAIFGSLAANTEVIEHVEAEPVEESTPKQANPSRTFNVSKAIINTEDGTIENEEECWEIAGMQAPAVSIDLEQKLTFVKRVIRHLQVEIDDITACADAEIRDRVNAMNYLHAKYASLFKQVDVPKLKKGKKSLRENGLGTFYRKTGGAKCFDRGETAQWLAKQDEDTQRMLGADWTLSFNVRNLYPFAQELKIPGIAIIPEDEFGKVSIGADKAWSPTKAKDRISGAFKSLKKLVEEDADEKEDLC